MMLKLIVDVSSGIDGFHSKVVVKPNNRDLFLQGILLFLMGERISLHADNSQSEDEQSLTSDKNLQRFLAKLELKGVITKAKKNVDMMLFSQHKKDGVPRYSGFVLNKGEYVKTSNETSRLNQDYAKYFQDGLFDMFAIPNDVLDGYIQTWEDRKVELVLNIEKCTDDDLYFKASLTKHGAKIVHSIFKQVISTLGFIGLNEYHISDDPYFEIMGNFEATKDAAVIYRSKAKKYNEVDKERSKCSLIRHQIRMCLYTVKYLEMYDDKFISNKQPACSQFGHKGLNMKSKAGVEQLIHSIKELHEPIVEQRSSNSGTEFYKSIMQASSYSVATSTPVLNNRYDGRFDLYVKSDIDTLSEIQSRILTSNRYYLNVGKRSLGVLRKPSGVLPCDKFSDISDDVKNT